MGESYRIETYKHIGGLLREGKRPLCAGSFGAESVVDKRTDAAHIATTDYWEKALDIIIAAHRHCRDPWIMDERYPPTPQASRHRQYLTIHSSRMIVADTVWNAFVWKQDPSYDYCAIFNTPYLGIKLTLGDHFQHGTLIITSRPLTHDTTPEQIKDRGGLVERRKTKWCSFDVRRHVLAYERGDWEKPLRWYARPENIEDTLNRLERETDRVQKEREAYLASPEYAALQAKLKEKAKHPERREEMGPFDIFEPGDWWINTTITS